MQFKYKITYNLPFLHRAIYDKFFVGIISIAKSIYLQCPILVRISHTILDYRMLNLL